MNERIENLLYQSGLTAHGCWDKFDEYDKQALAKFAELIVRECSTLAYGGPNGILEHFDFGVEE